MSRPRRVGGRFARMFMLMAACCGGTLFESCEVRLHDAFIAGSKQVFLSFFDPQNLADLFDNPNGTEP